MSTTSPPPDPSRDDLDDAALPPAAAGPGADGAGADVADDGTSLGDSGDSGTGDDDTGHRGTGDDDTGGGTAVDDTAATQAPPRAAEPADAVTPPDGATTPPPPPGRGDPPPPPRDGATPPRGGPGGPPPPGRPSRLRTLDRRSRDRVIAGVAGGLGDYFNVDPAIFRLAFICLMFFGGAGLPLYGLAWLILPDRDTGKSVGDGLLARLNVSNRSTAQIILAILVLIILVNTGGELLWAALLIGLGVLLFRRDGGDGDDDRRDRRVPTAPPAPVSAAGSGPQTPPAPPPAPPSTAPADDDRSSATFDPPPSANPYDDAYYEDLLTAAPPAPDDGWRPTPLSEPPQPPPPPSILGRVTVAAALIVVGAVALLDMLTAISLPATSYFAMALTVVGGGLLIGARWGRARGLIALGAVLVLGLTAAAATPQMPTDGVGERLYVPRSVAALDDPYRLGVGELRIDLTRLELPPGDEVTLDASAALGSVQVVVPEGVGLEGVAEAELGDVSVLDDNDDGAPARVVISEPGPEGSATINLDLSAVLGEIVVERGEPLPITQPAEEGA